MARISGTARAAGTLRAVTRSRATPMAHPIEMKFMRVARSGGHDITFDLDVRAGEATDLAIVDPFHPEHAYYEEDLLSPATNGIRGVRVSTDRPLFVFSNGVDVLLSVQVDLSSPRARVMGTENPGVRVR